MEERERGSMGWTRALLAAVVVAVVSVVLLVWLPNLLVTKATRLVHSARVGIATAWFFLVLVGICVGLRQLQKRNVL
ncbi:MAG: hypothetical protein ACXVQY_06900 [Actinomycetota bacterium]